MKPERLIRATYSDILDSADPATIRVIGDLDALYTSASTPATPPFPTLLATRARAASRPGADNDPETAIRGNGDGTPPRSRRGWLRQGFAFAGAALAFALVATLLVLLFRDSDGSSTPGAQPDASPTATLESALPLTTNPDQIAFTSIRDGNPEIYLVNADGSGLTRLTNDPAADRVAAWSADGSQIAFISSRNGGNRLYLMNADGSDVRQVTGELDVAGSVAWSPDGEWIAFAANGSQMGFFDIYIVHADGSDLRQLTGSQGFDNQPSWTPNSRQIVYTSDRDGNDALCVSDITSAGCINLTNGVIAGRQPDWSPDGTRIAFASPSEPVIADGLNYGMLETITFYDTTQADGNPLRTTDIIGRSPRWSPDGRYIAYLNPDFEPGLPETYSETLHILQADSLETDRIPGVEGAMLDYDWSPDSQALSVVLSNINADGSTGDERSLWIAPLDGSTPIQIASQLERNTGAAWRPDPSRTPEISESPPDLALPTTTPDTSQPSEPLTPNALDSMAPLQPGQERHFVFDIRADYRIDESGFLTWNVKGSERMLPDGTLQQYMIARDASNAVLIEFVNDGERWWWNQRGWIEAGSTASGVVSLPEELRTALWEPRTVHRALTTDVYEQIDERTEGDTRITRYSFDDLSWIGQQLGVSVESAYYEVYTTGDPVEITRTRIVLVTPDDEERQEYALADISFTDVILIPADDGPGNYVVPEAPAEGTFQYTPPATLPGGLTLTRHYHDFMAGMEWINLTDADGISITALVYPSRGSFDTHPMQQRSFRNAGKTVATGFIAGGDIAWLSDDTDGWPLLAIWDNGRYRIELSIGNVTSLDQWNEDELVALIYALAGEEQD